MQVLVYFIFLLVFVALLQKVHTDVCTVYQSPEREGDRETITVFFIVIKRGERGAFWCLFLMFRLVLLWKDSLIFSRVTGAVFLSGSSSYFSFWYSNLYLIPVFSIFGFVLVIFFLLVFRLVIFSFLLFKRYIFFVFDS